MDDRGSVDTDGLDAALADACRRSGVPGAQVGLIRGGERVVICTGAIEYGRPDQITASTTFHAGSIAKPLAALVVLDAAQRGELELDVPCSAQSSAGWDDTPRAIMAQTTGRLNVLPELDEDLVDYVARVATMPRAHAPGRFSYSNASWPVLDLVLRDRTGSTFEELAAERVLRPESSFGPHPGDSTGHAIEPGGEPQVVDSTLGAAASASGTRWWVTADQLLDFATLHLTGGGGRVADGVVEQMQQRQVDLPGATVADGWGLGWALWQRGGHSAYGWAGLTGGHRAFLRCFPEQGAAVVLLANAAGPLFRPAGGSQLFDELLPDLLDRLGVPALPPPSYTATASAASELAGGYGPFQLTAEGSDAVLLHAGAFGEPEPLLMVRSGGNTFEADGRPPGTIAIAVEDDLLYLGPFAVPRTG